MANAPKPTRRGMQGGRTQIRQHATANAATFTGAKHSFY